MARTRISLQRESDLKAWVLGQLLDQGRIDPKTVLANEFALPSVDIRTDLALLADEFTGIEIKGPLDSLRRLPRQIEAYGRIFDRTILVCSSAHIVRVLGRVPCVELWEVTKDYKLVIHHEPTFSSRTIPDRLSLEDAGIRRSALIKPFEVDPRERLLDTFTKKFSPSSERFWGLVGRRRPKASDITALSRFLEKRRVVREAQASKEQFWSAWHEQASDFFS